MPETQGGGRAGPSQQNHSFTSEGLKLKHVDTIMIENQLAWYWRSVIFRGCVLGPSVVKQTEEIPKILCFRTFICRFVPVRFWTSHLEDDSDVLASNKQIIKAQLAHRKLLLNHRDGLNMCQYELCRKKKKRIPISNVFLLRRWSVRQNKRDGCVFPRVRSLVNKACLLTSLCMFLWFPRIQTRLSVRSNLQTSIT